MNCPHCASATTKEQSQKTTLGYSMFHCSACKPLFNERTGTPFNFLEYPTDVVLLVLVEQDHRFIKRLVKPGMGFFSFQTAWSTLRGYESMNMIRKGQMHGVEKGNIIGQISFIASLFGLVA